VGGLPTSSHPAPDWILRMHADFARTGHYRSQDVHRLLGDPRTQVGPRESVEDLAAVPGVTANCVLI
jgi:hypothetical protein